mgnify:FL=1|jgi:hypothetical protein|tara:strand:- start:44 stop:433 length:390 start_codon:yes stop_codon:yes gene_type:complete
MAHFAKINTDNIVVDVVVVKDSEILIDGSENEQKGIDFLNSLFNTNYNWKKTSYNTYSGVHINDGTPFRKNFAGIGFTYDSGRDAFISPKPFNSWSLNETTCQWEAPVAYPDDNKKYRWNEDTTSWDEI